MGSFLTALANIGSQYAEGTTAGKEEKEKLAQEKARTGLEQTQQQLEKQRLDYQMQQLAQYKAEAPLREAMAKADAAKANYYDIYTPDGRRVTIDLSKGKPVTSEDQGLADPKQAANMQQAQAYVSGQDKSIQPELSRRLTVGWAMRQPWPEIMKNLEGQVDKYNAEKVKGGGGAGAGDLISAFPEATAGNWDPDVQAKAYRRMQLAQYMKNPGAEMDKIFTEADNTMKQRAADKAKAAKEAAKGQELTAGASKAVYSTLPTLGQSNDLIKDIDKLGLANNHTRGYLFAPYWRYRAGDHGPTPTLAKDIAGFSLGSVTEAVSALGGSTRAYAALQLALVHTPNAMLDSPAQMKEKLTEINTRLNRIVKFAMLFGRKGATPSFEQAMRMVGTPEDEIRRMIDTVGPAGIPESSGDTGIPSPAAPAQTDVPQAAPAPAAGGGLSPAAQAVLDSYQKKPPAGSK